MRLGPEFGRAPPLFMRGPPLFMRGPPEFGRGPPEFMRAPPRPGLLLLLNNDGFRNCWRTAHRFQAGNRHRYWHLAPM